MCDLGGRKEMTVKIRLSGKWKSKRVGIRKRKIVGLNVIKLHYMHV
jgi:hypothetical protein